MPLFLALAGWVPHIACAQVAGDAAVQAQWFTGSLAAPSPALPKAGLLAIEPYVVYEDNTGVYDNSGRSHSSRNDVRQDDSVTVFKYGITNRLSIEALPSWARVWKDQTRATGVGDLPMELEYRFNDENNRTGFPSVTAVVGVTLPLGHYDRLKSPLDGLGSGAYTIKEGILLQSLFDTWGHHPMRWRFYGAAFEPSSEVSVTDTSVYGTTQGFRGRGMPGFSSEFGVGAGYGLDQRWVLAFDFVQKFSDGSRIRGIDASGSSVNTTAAHSARTSVAPAVEYNFSGRIGVIAGVEFSVAGRNTASYVAPQIALSMAF
ncbi:MAG: hypothetical protein ABI885_22570 [Gammaproteobacteria bacterium]